MPEKRKNDFEAFCLLLTVQAIENKINSMKQEMNDMVLEIPDKIKESPMFIEIQTNFEKAIKELTDLIIELNNDVKNETNFSGSPYSNAL